MEKNFLRSVVLVAGFLGCAQASALTTDPVTAINFNLLANQPMGGSISPDVKPNVMFILDVSGSMAWGHLADSPLGSYSAANGAANPNQNNSLSRRYAYASHHCNPMYFDPAIQYDPPMRADGTPYPASSFLNAWNDGYNTGSGTTNLSTNFRAYTTTLTYDNFNDTPQAAYYYAYSGTQPDYNWQYQNSGVPIVSGPLANLFTLECASNPGNPANEPGDSVFTRVNVATASAAVKQNFANWYSYYRTRINLIKTATGKALYDLDKPNQIRIGLASHETNSSSSVWFFVPIADFSDTVGVVHQTNNCSTAATQRSKLYCYLYTATVGGGTPTRTALSKTGQMYAGTGSFIGTGKPDPVKFSCQRNAVILATDGYWNSDKCPANFPCVGNADSSAPGFGTLEFGATGIPRIDTNGASSESLADIAAYYWKTDLRTSGPYSTNNVPTTTKDVANWQHMNTFTLGLGANGDLKYRANYESETVAGCALPGADCSDYLRIGTSVSWPDPDSSSQVTSGVESRKRMDDLWHAAVNGRGTYFSASTVEAVSVGLKKAFSEAGAAGAGGAAALGTQQILGGEGAYLATYESDPESGWFGDLQMRTIDKNAEVSNTAVWSAQPLLDARATMNSDTRTIYMAKNGTLVNFNAANLTTAIANKWFDAGPTNPNGPLEQYAFFTATQISKATPTSLVNYIRGWHEYEDPANAVMSTIDTALYRGRKHILGDIVNSSPVYVKNDSPMAYRDPGFSAYKNSLSSRRNMVYVGGNDGMLHAFDASNGAELWAFVPTAVVPYLYKLADKNYVGKHRYYVDGALTVSDVYINDQWRTVITVGLGKGGRAYAALDITNPDSPSLLWEFGATADDTTNPGLIDPDLGFTYGNASMTKRDGEDWVAIFGSGYYNYDSPVTAGVTEPGDGRGRLFVLNAKTGVKLLELPTSGGTDPESSAIGWVNGWTNDGMQDNSVRHVYAGDLAGRIWRFDIKNSGGVDLLTTLGGNGWVQPVTTRVELGDWRDPDANLRVIYVGTGRYLGYRDVDFANQLPAAKIHNSIYAIRDYGDALKSNIGSPYFRNSGAASLASGDRNSGFTYNAVLTNGYGWYLDLVDDGERVNVMPRITVDQSTLMVVTNVPNASDKCAIGGTGYIYWLDAQSPKSRYVNVSDTVISVGSVLVTGASMVTTDSGEEKIIVNTGDKKFHTYNAPVGTYGNTRVRHISWRELPN